LSSFQNTGREEFPWLALLEYRKGKQRIEKFWQSWNDSMICSHRRTFDQLRWKPDKSQICFNSWSLLDGRHYSTSRCTVSLWGGNQLHFSWFIATFSVNVRLGDHDLSLHKNCAGRHCGNPMRVNEIDEVVPHESFNPRAINRRHDIGLIRLRASVHFSSEKSHLSRQ
jgi:hypothetical protein